MLTMIGFIPHLVMYKQKNYLHAFSALTLDNHVYVVFIYGVSQDLWSQFGPLY